MASGDEDVNISEGPLFCPPQVVCQHKGLRDRLLRREVPPTSAGQLPTEADGGQGAEGNSSKAWEASAESEVALGSVAGLLSRGAECVRAAWLGQKAENSLSQSQKLVVLLSRARALQDPTRACSRSPRRTSLALHLTLVMN